MLFCQWIQIAPTLLENAFLLLQRRMAVESEIREGMGLMLGAESPCQELGGGIGIGGEPLDQMDLGDKPPWLLGPLYPKLSMCLRVPG